MGAGSESRSPKLEDALGVGGGAKGLLGLREGVPCRWQKGPGRGSSHKRQVDPSPVAEHRGDLAKWGMCSARSGRRAPIILSHFHCFLRSSGFVENLQSN